MFLGAVMFICDLLAILLPLAGTPLTRLARFTVHAAL
jgi:hypothetical protein